MNHLVKRTYKGLEPAYKDMVMNLFDASLFPKTPLLPLKGDTIPKMAQNTKESELGLMEVEGGQNLIPISFK